LALPEEKGLERRRVIYILLRGWGQAVMTTWPFHEEPVNGKQ